MGRTATCAAAGVSVLVLALLMLSSASGALARTSAARAVRVLNLQRQANGIPGGLLVDARRNRGCRLHLQYQERNGEDLLTHYEDPAKPGYTALGADAGLHSELALGGITNHPIWQLLDYNPWANAPLHLAGLMDPGATSAWYAEQHDAACMGTARSTRPNDPASRGTSSSPQFFSFPGTGARHVSPARRIADEIPYNPAVKYLGYRLGQDIGPWFLLYARSASGGDTELVPRAATVTGPTGTVPSRLWYDPTRMNGALFIDRRLPGDRDYTITVEWTAPGGEAQTQTIRFHTATKTLPGRLDRYTGRKSANYTIRHRLQRRSGWPRVTVLGRNATGRRATVSFYRVLGTPNDAHTDYRRPVRRQRIRLRKRLTLAVPSPALHTGSGWVYVVVETKAFKKRIRDPEAIGGSIAVVYGRQGVGVPVRVPLTARP